MGAISFLGSKAGIAGISASILMGFGLVFSSLNDMKMAEITHWQKAAEKNHFEQVSKNDMEINGSYEIG